MSPEIVKTPGKKNSVLGPVRDNGSCIREIILERQKKKKTKRYLVKVPTPDLCPKL